VLKPNIRLLPFFVVQLFNWHQDLIDGGDHQRPPVQQYLLCVTDTSHRYASYKFEDLSCFLSGLFTFSAHTILEGDVSPQTRELHQWAARGLGYTCYVLYADQQSGLGSDTDDGQREKVGRGVAEEGLFKFMAGGVPSPSRGDFENLDQFDVPLTFF
jgi:hypothetical protein